jgi:ribosomal protein S18 acetylase RimI-like enzyme
VTAIEPAGMGDLERLVECWLALAAGQRQHGSLVDPADNAGTVRESIAQHVLAEGVLVAREAPTAAGGDDSVADDGDDRGDGEIVGFVMFGPDETGFERDRPRGVVRNVFVEPDARGQGVGTTLMDAAERRLAEAGAEELVLDVMADNDGARRFYRGRGYEPHRVTVTKPLESDTPTR